MEVITNKSIAVLPFVNMSVDPENEYFSDGITEEIINALTKVHGLKVTARTSSFSFKNKNIDIREIGQQLGVATVLEGSVRRSSKKIRITAQLIQANDGFHLWSKNFDRELENIFAVQDEISLLIADQIRENFGHLEIQEHLIDAPTQNLTAYNLYLKGRHHHLKWNREGIATGIACYEQCIEEDPTFALPYFGIGYSYAMRASFRANVEDIKIAESYLKKGFRISNSSYLGFYARATLEFWAKWDFKTAHRAYLKAIELNPSFTETEEGLIEMYTILGEFERATKHTQNILTLNPLSPNHYYTEGNIYYLSRQYSKALESLQAALRIDPNFSFAIELSLMCYIQLKEYQKLEQLLQQYNAQSPDDCRALYKLVHPDEDIDIDLTTVRSIQEIAPIYTLIPWHLYHQVYLDNHEMALNILEEAVKKRTGQFAGFKFLPLLDPIRKYDRYQRLVEQVFAPAKLPDYEGEIDAGITEKALLTPEEVTLYLSATTSLLEDEELYLDPTLSLKSLAGSLDLHPNKLSWLLNEHIGKNFNEFVNSYRLEAFKIKSLDPANSHLTLLGLAYESGFNSKTVFNTFFKKMENLTPKAWVKAQKNN